MEQQREWRAKGLVTNLAINLSAHDLDEHLPLFVLDVLADTGVPAGAVSFEVTEGVIMDNPERALECLNQLHDVGTRIALDDFGTGHSALSYLSELPVSELKIDRSFVQAALTRNRDRIILESIVRLGTRLDLDVVAEGVKDHATLDLLKAIGCPTAQGYFFTRPLSPAKVFEWLESGASGVRRAA